MPQILVDDKTLAGLESVAKARGLTVGGYLQCLVEQEGNGNLPAFSVADFERELDELATDAATLPRDFLVPTSTPSMTDALRPRYRCPASAV